MTKTVLTAKIGSPSRSSYRKSSSLAAGALFAAGTLLAAMVTVSATTTPAHAAPICYSGGVVQGNWKSGVIKKNAEKRARKSWGDAAQKAVGSSRARKWKWALNRDILCDKSRGFWHCNASARPCF